MSCSVDMYQHPEKGGLHARVTGTIKKFDTTRPGGIPNNHVSSFQVNGCNNTVVTACRHDQYHDKGQDCMYLKGYNRSLHWRRKYNDNNWADEWDSIVFTPVPTEDANNLEYNRENNHYTPASPNDGYCGGCRLWPQVKDRNNPANANRDDVWLTDQNPGYKGVRPCPGGKGYFTSGTGVKCIYSKSDARQLETLKNAIGSDNGLSAMYTDLVTKFCNIPDNITKNPGGQTCLERDSGSRIAKQYCSVGARIKDDGACTPTNLGNYYNDLAEAYCKTAAGKVKEWCSCYNVTNNVCDTDPNAGGCAVKKQQFDKLVEATPEGFRHVWSGRAACFGGVCQGNKYVPQNANQNCNAPIQICAQSFDLSQISESSIEAQCNLSATSGTQPSAGDGTQPSTGGGGGTQPSTGGGGGGGTQPSTGGGDEGINKFIPTSIEDLKTDKNKQLSVGGFTCICCCCCCIILLLLMSGGSNSNTTIQPRYGYRNMY
jgi:hypothetical protein